MRKALRRRILVSIQSFSEVFANADLRRLVLASGGYFTGDWAYTVALSVYAYQIGGAGAVGLVGLIRMVPAGLVAPFGALLADRYRRERVLLFVYAASGAIVALSAVLFVTVGSAAAIFVLAGLISAVSAVLRPAQWALVPHLARTPRQLAAANATFSLVEGIATFLGPAIGAIVLTRASTGLVFGATAALFGLAAILTARITGEITSKIQHVREAGPSWTVAVAGFRVIARQPRLRLLVSLFGAQTFVRGLLNVLIVVVAVEFLGLGGSGVGILHAAVGVGGLLGGLLALGLAGRRRLARPFGLGLFLWGPPIALLAVLVHPAAAILLLAVPGIGNAIGDVSGTTLLQRITRDEVLARVFGVLEGFAMAMIGVGSIAAPAFIAWLGSRGAFVAAGAILPVAVLLAWRGLRAIDDDAEVPEREIELLGALPLFEPLPVVALEQVASRAHTVRVPAGKEVFHQGDRGDRFYLIVDGRVEVRSKRRIAAVLGPGEYFGEIALLRDVPRTATVAVIEDAELLAIDRDDFVASVAGHADTARSADAVIGERLRDLDR